MTGKTFTDTEKPSNNIVNQTSMKRPPLQYGVRGPRENILPESNVFPEDRVFVSCDNIKLASSKLKYLFCNSKKGERNHEPFVREFGPWSPNHVSSPKKNL